MSVVSILLWEFYGDIEAAYQYAKARCNAYPEYVEVAAKLRQMIAEEAVSQERLDNE